jgi:hypothetical protein
MAALEKAVYANCVQSASVSNHRAPCVGFEITPEAIGGGAANLSEMTAAHLGEQFDVTPPFMVPEERPLQ